MSPLHDLRYAWRTLARSKSFAILAILLLGLGMGASTAIFSLTDSVLLKTLAVKDPSRLVLLTNPQASGVSIGTDTGTRAMLTYAEFKGLQEHLTSFSHVFAADSQWRALSARIDGRGPEEVRLRLVSGDYFAGLGVPPFLGRVFTIADEQGPGSAPDIVVSYRYWRERFGSSAEVFTHRVAIQGTSYRIIGVMPPQFLGEDIGSTMDFWIPMVMQPQIRKGQYWLEDDATKVERITWLQVFGRLRDGVTLREAQAEADVVFHRIVSASFARFADRQPQLLRENLKLRLGAQGASSLRGQFSEPLYVLLGMVGVLLLTACANVAGLMLARVTARQKEVALRMALGANRLRLVRQFLAESILVSVAASGAGALIAAFATEAVIRLASGASDPITLDLRPDYRVFAFVAAIASVAAAISGLIPALLSTRANLHDVLKGTAAGVLGGLGRARAGKIVVASQIALSTLLLMAAGWFAFTLRNLERVDLGYPRDHLLEVRVDPVTAGYRGPRLAAVYQQLQQGFSRLPGVRAVAYSDNGLYSGRESQDEITIEGYSSPSARKPDSRWDQVGPGYFSIVGIPVLKGREIAPTDRQGAPRVCVINRAFAEQFFPKTDPIGKHITNEYPDTHFTFQIVGVSGNAHDKSLRDRVPPRFYIPALQPLLADDYTDSMNYEIRTFADPGSLVAAARQQVGAVDPEIRINFVLSLDDLIANQTLRDRLIARLALASGALALLITCLGLYAVLSYSVARRISEIGIRIALGARPGQITRDIVGEALTVAVLGLAFGVPLALALSSLVKTRIFGLSAADPATVALVVMVLILTAVGAALAPARRAALVDPLEALRSE
ncbi:MAG: ABC transporter permease [Acidobacteriia bacterium]|nr:ABC transporter permease [Terriglobia bacterium]